MNRTVRIFFLVAAFIAAVSCSEMPRRGDFVNFSARVHKGALTKAAYVAYTGGGHQDIVWTAGDEVAIYSDDTDVAATSADGARANYTLKVDSGDATLAKLGDEAGLRWNEAGEVTFYGVYPSGTASPSIGKFNMSIPYDQSHALGENTLASSYMVAKTKFESGSNNVTLEFFPVFTTFEIHLKNQESTELTLTTFAIKSSDSAYLTGQYQTDWTSTNRTYTLSDGYSKAEYTFPSNTTITDTKEVSFNLFLLPVNLTNLYLEISYETDLGESRTRTLQLKQGGEYISFDGCKKHIINGLALDSSDFWKLEVNGTVLDWNGIDQIIKEEVSISTKVAISGAIESTAQWKGESPTHSKGNHYADSYWVDQDDPAYGTGPAPNYDKNYQIRTLNKDLPSAQRYFTLTFTPSAPTGGYWQLIPMFRDDDVQSPNHFRFERNLPGGGTSDELKGQILTQPETIRIIPVNWDPSDVNTYDVWFTCRFSTTPTFSHSINADSEFQDIHGDGRFSYWVFRIKQYSAVYPTE